MIYSIQMCSVSLALPFITDLVNYHKRGLAYAYIGCLFTLAVSMVYLLVAIDIQKYMDTKWIFVAAGILGVTVDLLLCWGLSDIYLDSLKKKQNSFKYLFGG